MKRKKLTRISALFLALSLALTGAAVPAAAESPSTLTVSLESQLDLSLGSSQTLAATVETPLPGGTDVTWAWNTDKEGVVRVTSDRGSASIKAVGVGTTPLRVTATATVDGKTVRGEAMCTVNVQFPAAVSIAITPTSPVTLDGVGRTADLSATVSPSAADPTNVEWSSSDTSVAVVEPRTGRVVTVTAKAPGVAVITASSGGTVSPECLVQVRGLVMEPKALTLTVGGSKKITATPMGGVSGQITWTSGNETVATVSPTGEVTGRSAGKTQITATADGQSAVCEITVEENIAGVITDTASAGQPLRFSGLESEINSRCRDVLGDSLAYVSNLSVSTDQGILYYGYVSADDTGAGVGGLEKYYYGTAGKGQRALSDVTFVAKPEFSGTAVVQYTGYDSGGRFFNGTIKIGVEETADVVYSTGKNTPVTFRAADFSAICRNQNGRDLEFLTFTLPSGSYGTLYYNYAGSGQLGTAVEAGASYYRTKNPYLDSVSFVPAEGYAGTVRVPYSGEDTAGNRIRGRVTIYVSGGGTAGRGDINYSTDRGSKVTFRNADFNSLCRSVTGDALDYVRFDPPSGSKGALYYNYSGSGSYDYKLDSSDRCYYGESPYLSRVSFVPKSGYSGAVEIPFTGYSNRGDRFSGTVEIAVGDGYSASGALRYHTERGEPVEFNAADFNDCCKEELGVTLDYVRFDLPASSRGTLYYDYSGGRYDSKVSSSTRYYRGESPSLSRVSFVPERGYTGTVRIDFTGYGSGGDRFSGVVEVTVGDSGGEATVSYKAKVGRPVEFSAADFNAACRDLQGVNLDYVRFDPPDSDRGVLYYNYVSGGSNDGKVSSSTQYYRSGGSRSLSKVTFVPAPGSSGTVKIGYTGWDTDGDRFTGEVRIAVEAAEAKLSYAIRDFEVLAMDPDDFNGVCKDLTGKNLDRVTFTPPSAGQGALYYDYQEGGGSKVSSGSYSRTGGGRQLDRVSFVPARGYTGTAEISYTGWSTGGDRYTGVIQVAVTAPVAGVIRYTTDTMPVHLKSGDFAGICRDMTGQDLDYVRLTPPESGQGRLYYRYRGPTDYEAQVQAGVSYYDNGVPALNEVTFVPRAGYQGTVKLSYTGTNTAGRSYTGAVEISVTGVGTSEFRDMADYGWASSSVDYLYRNGIVKGISGTEFGPGQLITRADFILMLCRAFDLNTGSTDNFSDVSGDSYYAWATATAKALGIAQGNGAGRFFPGGAVTRQDAAVFLQKTMGSAGQSVPDGDRARLSAYADGGEVSDYAAGAMAAMLDLGILKGGGEGRLNPGGELTRAEMAVMLHRALTL